MKDAEARERELALDASNALLTALRPYTTDSGVTLVALSTVTAALLMTYAKGDSKAAHEGLQIFVEALHDAINTGLERIAVTGPGKVN